MKSVLRVIGITLLLMFVGILISFKMISGTKARYLTISLGDSDLKVATWNFNVNGKTTSGGIDLSNTITTNSYSMYYVIPGTNGVIPLSIDNSNNDVSYDYVITLDTNKMQVPTNLKFYTDSSYTTEFNNNYSGFISYENNNTITHNLYWKWDFNAGVDETEEWGNKEIIVYFNITATQRIEGDIQ